MYMIRSFWNFERLEKIIKFLNVSTNENATKDYNFLLLAFRALRAATFCDFREKWISSDFDHFSS